MSLRSSYPEKSSYRLVSRTLLLTLFSGALAACSGDIARISDQEYTAAVAQQRSFLNQAPLIGQKSTPRQPLPAAPLSAPTSATPAPVYQQAIQPIYVPTPVVVHAQPTPQLVQQAVYRPTPANLASSAPAVQPMVDYTNSSATPVQTQNTGWSQGSGTTISIVPGDTLYSISRRYGVSQQAILNANGIRGPQDIIAGRNLIIPTQGQSARTQGVRVQTQQVGVQQPVQAAASPTPFPAQPVASAPQPRQVAVQQVSVARPQAQTTRTVSGGQYKVATGDTLYGIARRNGVSVEQLKAANGLGTSNNIKLGQTLVIPGVQSPQLQQQNSIQVSQSSLQQPRIVQQVAVQPRNTVVQSGNNSVASSPQPAAYSPQTQTNNQVQQSHSSLSFRPPVNGRIISSFGQQTNGERNDGVTFAVPEGTPVKASEDGVVIYAGNELKSYGNLVLVRHTDGWVTAYAHNSNMQVRRGDAVKRGQQIAQAGSTGSVTSPQLRFELRKGSTPVNPLDHLGGV